MGFGIKSLLFCLFRRHQKAKATMGQDPEGEPQDLETTLKTNRNVMSELHPVSLTHVVVRFRSIANQDFNGKHMLLQLFENHEITIPFKIENHMNVSETSHQTIQQIFSDGNSHLAYAEEVMQAFAGLDLRIIGSRLYVTALVNL